MAIAGMIELLTPCRARGWVYDGDNPFAPLMLRVRDGEALLAENMLPSESAFSPGQPAQALRLGDFCIEFSSKLRIDSMARLTVEAARLGEGRWHALPRYPRLWSPPEKSTALLVDDWQDRKEQEKPAWQRPFWSDVPAETSFDSSVSRPVFVIGPVRSGTTALCLALEKGTRYQGFPEGHVLDVAIRLVNAINLHFERKETIAVRDICAYHLGNTQSSRFFSEAVEMVRRLGSGYTTPFWFDKTPTYPMVASVPILANAWPNARFIFMKRRGLESMRSRLRKFSKVDFRASCTDWALIMAGWRNVRKTVPGRFIEIDQRDLDNDRETVGISVGELLGLDPSEVAAFVNVLKSERPEATGPSTQAIGEVSELGWSEEQLGIFREVCGKEMEAYGYTYDESYHC
jgi:Sulfotransferase family